jgi:hypothetical protein
MSGGVTLSLDEPNQEQKAAAQKVRNILFKTNSIEDVSVEQNRSYNQERIELEQKLTMSDPLQVQTLLGTRYTSENQEMLNKFHHAKAMQMQNEYERIMLQSPMFTNVDGFTAMNDTSDVCVGAECTTSALESMTGQTNAGESFLDDFFPQPLQPFSF